jgi:Tfp pilus assembly protein PilF
MQGNLAWAYMQQRNFMAAEVVYRKAQMIDPDANKACNLALCLIEEARLADAQLVLTDVLAGRYQARDQQDGKIVRKVEELLVRIMAQTWQGGGGGGRRRRDESDDDDDDDWVARSYTTYIDQ